MSMKKKRAFSFLLLMLTSATVMLTVRQYTAVQAETEDVIYREVTLEDEFADDRVVIVLNKEASMNFKTYTPEDFPEGLFRRVDDSTALTMELVRKQLKAEETGDWSELEFHVENAMLVDVNNFRRILDLILVERGKENVLKAIRLLEGREDILHVGPDFFASLAADPNPPPTYYNTYQKNMFDQISLRNAWNITTGSSSIVVGVVDSGIDGGHPALNNRLSTNIPHMDFTDTSYPQGIQVPIHSLYDQDGHGTIIAGVIGANGTGVIGVNWNIALVSLKVFHDNGSSQWSYVRYAIDYATSNGIPILNMSLGGYVVYPQLETAIRNYPGLAVCAAGNDGLNTDLYPFIPASYNLSNVIAVGATKKINDNRADSNDWALPAVCPGANCLGGSNYGLNSVDIFAPGVNIATTVTRLHTPSGYSYNPGASGTSLAAPFVTGVAALIKSTDPYMRIPAHLIKRIILKNVDNVSGLNGLSVTGGRLNAYKALDFATAQWPSLQIACATEYQTCYSEELSACYTDCGQQAWNCGGPTYPLCWQMLDSCIAGCEKQADSICMSNYLSCEMSF